ncbi:hypothetical protein E2C01_044399 [Portunus trituberculatus]|uniref:Uncharacterized protein n=1 Tax=Portunus trituberculatus TaxID=210409 RepID=A0A5B7FS10_PORTR|nr:hypothetical protein [Portunus trituberculatus]
MTVYVHLRGGLKVDVQLFIPGLGGALSILMSNGRMQCSIVVMFLRCHVTTRTSYVLTPYDIVTLTTTPETMEHFLLQCPDFHSQHTALCSWLSTLAITTLDLPTPLAASGVHPSWQPAVLRLTYAFLKKTGQLPCL